MLNEPLEFELLRFDCSLNRDYADMLADLSIRCLHMTRKYSLSQSYKLSLLSESADLQAHLSSRLHCLNELPRSHIRTTLLK